MPTTTRRPDVLIVTRGFRHNLPPGLLPADVVYDLREKLSDPAHRPEGDMLDMTGLDPVVRDFVFATRGAEELLKEAVRRVRAEAEAGFTVVHVGCAGGKHRAPAVGQELAVRLRASGLRVAVRHLHVHLPRIVGADERANA